MATKSLFVWVKRPFLTSEVISRRCLLVAVISWPMCCYTEMPCGRDKTWHPTQLQYTGTGPTCRFAIHWCGTSHWNTQLPISIYWVRPDREILPRPSTHTSESDAVKVIISWKLGRKNRTNRVLNPWSVLHCEAITLSARPLRLQKRIGSFDLIVG